jgi:uncharacterized protein (TIGR03000 family)
MAAASGGGGSASRGGGGGSGGSSSGGGGSSGDVTQSLQELKKSIEEVKKEHNKIRIDALKLTAEELRLKATEQKIDEIRRNLEEMRQRMPAPLLPPARPRQELPPPQPGKVLLDVPADARVLINNQQIDSATAFLTPALEPGREYAVTVQALLRRDGRNLNRVKRLSLRAGQVVRLAYNDMEGADGRWTRSGETTALPAHITVRLPADARLTVDSVDCPLTSDTRTFDTPALVPWQKYYYLLKAEVVRNGRTIAQTRRADFLSGERISVSFDDLGTTAVSAR